MELLINRDEKINLARYAYLLARLEPDNKATDEQKDLYHEFSKQMYQWMQNDKDCKELITAIYIYAYLTREKEEDKNAKIR
ncbi:MAG: hypothetical protein PHE70_09065 [Tepidanaerobacteraceae bacterium]|nr:hypothetical protein [Tepidanaerobacteraceae bacterium]